MEEKIFVNGFMFSQCFEFPQEALRSLGKTYAKRFASEHKVAQGNANHFARERKSTDL